MYSSTVATSGTRSLGRRPSSTSTSTTSPGRTLSSSARVWESTRPSGGRATGRKRDVDHPLEPRLRVEPLDGHLARARPETQPGRHPAQRLDRDHPRPAGDLVERVGRARLEEAERHVLALHHVPLHPQQLVDRVDHEEADHHHRAGDRDAEQRDESPAGPPLEIAQDDPGRLRQQVAETQPFGEGAPVFRRRLGTHRLGRRQPHRMAHRGPGAHHRGDHADPDRPQHHVGRQTVFEEGKRKKSL